jgi:hypothetical protein
MIKRYAKCLMLSVMSMHIGFGHAAEDFGRLFTNANQRQILNNMRTNQMPIQAKIFATPTFQGYVKRSDGVSTLWLDRIPVQQSSEQALVNAQSK